MREVPVNALLSSRFVCRKSQSSSHTDTSFFLLNDRSSQTSRSSHIDYDTMSQPNKAPGPKRPIISSRSASFRKDLDNSTSNVQVRLHVQLVNERQTHIVARSKQRRSRLQQSPLQLQMEEAQRRLLMQG